MYTPQLSPVGLLRIVLLARVLITARRRGGGNTRLDLLWVLRTVNGERKGNLFVLK